MKLSSWDSIIRIAQILSYLEDSPIPLLFILKELGIKKSELSLIRLYTKDVSDYLKYEAYHTSSLSKLPWDFQGWIKDVYGEVHGSSLILIPYYSKVKILQKDLYKEVKKETKYILDLLG
jgi:hypothetical protein